MKKNAILFGLVTILLPAIAGGVLSLILSNFISLSPLKISKPSGAPSPSATEKINTVPFNPPQPQEAPPDIRDAAGYNILMDTQKYAPQLPLVTK